MTVRAQFVAVSTLARDARTSSIALTRARVSMLLGSGLSFVGKCLATEARGTKERTLASACQTRE